MAVLLTNNFEGGSNGTAFTTGNTGAPSGNAFDAVTATVPNFSNLWSRGSLSAAVQAAGHVDWTAGTSFPASGFTTAFGRAYVLITVTPTVVTHIPSILTSASATASGFFELTTAAKILIQARGGTTVTSATVLSLFTWYRIEFKHVIVASGTCTFDCTIYLGDSTVPIETMTQATGTGLAGDTTFSVCRWGSTNANAANVVFFDDINLNDQGFPGPSNVAVAPQPAQSKLPKLGSRSFMRFGPPILLNQQYGFPSVAGPVTNFLTLTATQATTAALVKQVGKPIIASEAASASVAKRVGKPIAATQATTAVLVKQVGKTFAAAQATTASVAKLVGKIITVSEAASASVVKAITHSAMTATQATTATVIKQVRKTLTATQATSATLVSSLVHLITLTATQATSAVLAKRVGKPVAATQASSAALVKQVGKTLTASQASTGAVVKRVGKIITATQATSATLTRGLILHLTLTASQATVATVTKQVRKPIAASQATTASIAKRVGKAFATAQASAATLTSLVMTTAHAVIGIFQSSPRAGVSDSPTNADFTDGPNPGASSNPSSGKFD